MLSLLNFLKVSLCLHFAFFIEAKEVQIDSDTSIKFDNFVEHISFTIWKYRTRQILKFVNLPTVQYLCLTSSACLSLNMASASDDGGMFWCELLFADIFNSSHNFRENTTSNHFCKWVSTITKDVFLSWFLYLFSFSCLLIC